MITKEDVQHIAQLARIELTPEEEERFMHELSAILQFVEQLKKIDTADVEPMTGGTHLEQVVRKDDKHETDLEHHAGALINAAAATQDRWVKVKSVFE